MSRPIEMGKSTESILVIGRGNGAWLVMVTVSIERYQKVLEVGCVNECVTSLVNV
jgi:hypothetical protein